MQGKETKITFILESWPSGLRRTPGKRVSREGSRVRIPYSPLGRKANKIKGFIYKIYPFILIINTIKLCERLLFYH